MQDIHATLGTPYNTLQSTGEFQHQVCKYWVSVVCISCLQLKHWMLITSDNEHTFLKASFRVSPSITDEHRGLHYKGARPKLIGHIDCGMQQAIERDIHKLSCLAEWFSRYVGSVTHFTFCTYIQFSLKLSEKLCHDHKHC